MPARRAQLSRDRIRRSLTNLGECQLKLQKYAAAEVSLHEAWEMSKQDVNARWPYFNVQRLLATAMLKQKRYQEAEPLLLEAHEGLVRGSGANRYVRALFIPETIDSLVELYENTGQKAKAEHWKGKRAKDSK